MITWCQTQIVGKNHENQNQIAEPVQRWGTFEDAEYWRKQDFLRWTPAQRLNWLCEMLTLAYRTGALKPFGHELADSE